MNRKELIEVIKAIQPGLTKDNVVELAEFINFNENEIVSYNDKVSISYPYDSDIKGAVKGDELLKILQAMPDNIKIEKKKNKLVISKAGKNKIKAELNMMDIQLDIWPEIPEDFKPLPKNIVEGLKFCILSTSSDLSMGAFNCILINQEKIISCDNFRSSQFILTNRIELSIINPLLIPLNLAKILVNYEIVSYSQDDSWLFFEDEYGVIICCNYVEYKYPIEEVYSLFEPEGEVITLPDNFKSVLDRSEILSQINIENQKIVKLEFLKNKIIISSNSDTGQYTEELVIDYKGDELTIMINPVHMKQILLECSEFTLTESNIKFETDTFNHIIMLIAED